MKPWQIESAIAELCKDIERVVERREADAAIGRVCHGFKQGRAFVKLKLKLACG